jgi:hypothetical protein
MYGEDSRCGETATAVWVIETAETAQLNKQTVTFCLINVTEVISCEVGWGSHGGEYEGGCILGFGAMKSRRSLPMFQKSLLPPSSGR